MKVPGPIWILAALVALGPAAAATVEMPHQPVEEGLWWRICPGCYTLIHAKEKDRHLETLEAFQRAAEDGIPEEQLREMLQEDRHLETLETHLRAAEVPLRIRREEKKVAAAKRRGKPPGTRPVCRGCFSGLMLMGQPAQGGKEGTLPESLSESGGDSSRGD